MCPACITNYLTAATLLAGSTGGLAAVVLRTVKKIKVKENRDGTSKGRV